MLRFIFLCMVHAETLGVVQVHLLEKLISSVDSNLIYHLRKELTRQNICLCIGRLGDVQIAVQTDKLVELGGYVLLATWACVSQEIKIASINFMKNKKSLFLVHSFLQ